MGTTVKVKVTKAVLTELLGSQFKPAAKVWLPEEELVTIPSEMWELKSRNILSGPKPFTINEAHFNLEGNDFKFAFRSGVTPDEDSDIVITRFAAGYDYQCTSGRVIKKGEKALYAMHA